MGNRFCVLGGWSLEPQLLSILFQEDTSYIDSNEMLDSVIDNITLDPDWKMRLIEENFSTFDSTQILAGWSTGAIIAAALAPILKPKALFLFSPTCSFVRRDGFAWGTRSSLVTNMINELADKPNDVLEQFHIRCGFTSKPESKNYPVPLLQKGLFFLQHADLLNTPPPSCPVVCMHGRNDLIIPLKAGIQLCSKFNGVMHEFDGAHQFFINNSDKIKSIIESSVR